MKLSVIVPVYNMALDNKLQFCLDSLVKQTISEYEIIAVDDASTDASPHILKEYQDRYPQLVKVITHTTNKRQGGAKNTGLKYACGEWIGFVDSDDWVTVDFYEKLVAKAECTGADVVGCDYSLVHEHTMQVGKIVQNNTVDQVGILEEEQHKKLLMRSGSMVIKIYRHEVIKENQLDFPENMFYEDNCAGPIWSVYFKHFEKVEEPLYYYYQHNTSTVHHISVEKCQDRMKAASMFLEECKKRGLLEKYKKEIEFRFTELFYVITLFSYMQGMKHTKISFVRQMREELIAHFPDFQNNSYYQREIGEEEKGLIAMQMQSDIKFYLLYRLKLFIRKIKDFLLYV